MNKYAELRKIAILYAACRGILRVKLANTTAGQPQQQQTQQQTQQQNTQQQQDPQQQQAGMGGVGRSLGNTLQEYLTGGTSDPTNSAGGNAGEWAMNMAGKGYNAATKWMAGKGGWMGAVGNFLNKNQDKMGNVIAGANEMFGGTNMLQGMVRSNNMKTQMEQQQQAQANEQFNPDAMFAQAFQGMAQGANNMYRPQQYSGQTYRPSFA